MADPFDLLHASVEPIDPDPAFAARLRSRLQRALSLPKGVDMPRTALSPEPVMTTAAPHPGYAGVIPYLAVADARRALAWYADALGARPRGEPIVMPDGRIGHAELELAGAVVMLSDEHPEVGVAAPVPGQGSAVTLHLEVADVDASTERAVEGGATLDRPPSDNPYGRNAVVVDPFGHRWMISGALAGAGTGAPAPASNNLAGPGEVSYASLWVPDVEDAAAFYAEVLGWRYASGSALQGRRVEGVEPPLGLWGGQEQQTVFLCFSVDDVSAAVERVRAAGGQAEDPRREPYGLVADCIDDQGMAFALSETGGGPSSRAVAVGPAQGELAYFVLGVPETARARTFFTSVLGWSFTPGHVEDGWNIEGVSPRAGMHGGNEVPLVVPMFAVDDIATAVGRVRAAGGTASDPEAMPYGITADCTDDQGAAFYLGQLS
ncbi:MAG: VOC family protein [Actinomycetota bacterium]|nr:VOC family protein [Actinomycetota bacterium]